MPRENCCPGAAVHTRLDALRFTHWNCDSSCLCRLCSATFLSIFAREKASRKAFGEQRPPSTPPKAQAHEGEKHADCGNSRHSPNYLPDLPPVAMVAVIRRNCFVNSPLLGWDCFLLRNSRYSESAERHGDYATSSDHLTISLLATLVNFAVHCLRSVLFRERWRGLHRFGQFLSIRHGSRQSPRCSRSRIS